MTGPYEYRPIWNKDTIPACVTFLSVQVPYRVNVFCLDLRVARMSDSDRRPT